MRNPFVRKQRRKHFIPLIHGPSKANLVSLSLSLSLVSYYKAPRNLLHITTTTLLQSSSSQWRARVTVLTESAMSTVTPCALLSSVTALRPAISSGRHLQSGRASLSSQWRSQPLSVCRAVNPKGDHNPKTDLHPFNIPAFGKLPCNFSCLIS